MDADELPQLDGVSHRWVDVGTVRIHIAEAGVEHRGNGPSLVLVHGWPQHWWCWRHVIPVLAADHHVVALDLRGAGWSEVPPDVGDTYDKRVLAGGLASLIEQLGLDRPVLVGHDWGGWISLLVAGQAPAAIRGVVAVAIVAPWGSIPWYDMWRFGYQLVAGGRWGVAAHRDFGQRFLKLVFRLGSGPGFRFDPADRERYLARFRQPERAAAGRAMYRRFLRHEIRQARKGSYQRPPSDLPVLFVPGAKDGVLAPRLVRRGVRGVSAAVAVAPGAGHWVPEEAPEFLVAQVIAFLDRVASS